MATSRLGFFDHPNHLGIKIVSYLPDAIKQFGIDTSGFELEGDVNCAMIRGIPSSAIVNAITEGLGIKESDRAFGYDNLVDKSRHDDTYWIRVGYEKIPAIAANLARLNPDQVKEKKEKIEKSIIDKSTERAESFAKKLHDKIAKHNLSGLIVENLDTLNKMLPLKTINEVLTCNALVKSMLSTLKESMLSTIKEINQNSKIENTETEMTSLEVSELPRPGNR
jgi:hypothetical protein